MVQGGRIVICNSSEQKKCSLDQLLLLNAQPARGSANNQGEIKEGIDRGGRKREGGMAVNDIALAGEGLSEGRWGKQVSPRRRPEGGPKPFIKHQRKPSRHIHTCVSIYIYVCSQLTLPGCILLARRLGPGSRNMRLIRRRRTSEPCM